MLYLMDAPLYVLKCMIIAGSIVGLRRSANAQMAMMLITEIVWLAVKVPRLHVRRLFGMVERFVSVLTVLYLIHKLATNKSGLTESTRLFDYGTTMVVILYGIIVVSISFALFSLILILFQLCKRAILWYKNRNTSQVKPIEAKNLNRSDLLYDNSHGRLLLLSITSR